MQQRNASLEISSSTDASGHAREALTQPMLLDSDMLAHISGGGPNGGWTAQGPNGGWTAADRGNTVTPTGPNGGWR